jgi:RNA polymerase sigma-70 factor (ECF subfamily)
MSSVAISSAIAGPLTQDFDDVFRQYYDLVHGTAYGVTGKREDAEDVVQTVFLRLFRRGMSFELRKNAKAYLYRAAVNESLNIIRSRRRRPTTNLEHTDVAVEVAGPSNAEAIHRKLYEAIAELNPKAAEMLILRYVHEYTDAEIAKLLGRSRGTIAVTLYRARARLKKLLRASLGEEL